MPPPIYVHVICVFGVLVLWFECVWWGVGGCFLILFCSSRFGVWLVGVLFCLCWGVGVPGFLPSIEVALTL